MYTDSVQFQSLNFIDSKTGISYCLLPNNSSSCKLFLVSNNGKPRLGDTRIICGVLFVAVKFSSVFFEGYQWVLAIGNTADTQKALSELMIFINDDTNK